MRNDWPTTPSKNQSRSVEVWHHPTASPSELIAGTATDGVDLSAYVSSCRQSSEQATIELTWHTALSGTNQPGPGEWIQLKLNGQNLWRGFIDSASDFRLSRGTRLLRLVVNSREATELWKGPKRVSAVFPAGTTFDSIATNIAQTVGLSSNEYDLSGIGLHIVQQNMQLADLSAWSMLEHLLFPAVLEPWVNADGVLQYISRDVQRAPDRVLSRGQVLEIKGSRTRLSATRLILKWLSPELDKVSQQDQPIARVGITAGFFQLVQTRALFWSDDRTQRAENTYMRVVQSVNSGLLPVGEETYEQKDDFSGEVVVETSVWVPALATASLAGLIAAAAIPDKVTFGSTIPVGRVIHAVSEVALLLTMMSIGSGDYEIYGTPYDFIHPINTTEAYICNTPAWKENAVEVESDLIMDEEHAQVVSQSELRYRALEENSYGVVVIDDPNIERGDILELYDGSRLYVTEVSRDLTRGSEAKLNVDGFKVS